MRYLEYPPTPRHRAIVERYWFLEGHGTGVPDTIRDGAALGEAAVTCGYYDQAHMTRDFARLAETSPAAWRRDAGALAALFVS